MAVTTKRNILQFALEGDAVTGRYYIRKVMFYCGQQDHKLTLTDGDGFIIFSAVGLRLTTSDVTFDPPLETDGIIASEMSATIPFANVYLA